jgi:hypothetical protein
MPPCVAPPLGGGWSRRIAGWNRSICHPSTPGASLPNPSRPWAVDSYRPLISSSRISTARTSGSADSAAADGNPSDAPVRPRRCAMVAAGLRATASSPAHGAQGALPRSALHSTRRGIRAAALGPTIQLFDYPSGQRAPGIERISRPGSAVVPDVVHRSITAAPLFVPSVVGDVPMRLIWHTVQRGTGYESSRPTA